jgi:hypothetical protein
MNIRGWSLLLVVGAAPWFGCSGDDAAEPSRPDSAVTTTDAARPDSGGPAPQGDSGAPDASKPDGGVATDSSVPPMDGATTAADSGPRDSATNSGPRDGGTDSGLHDSGTNSGTDSGASSACTACEKKYCGRADYYYGSMPLVDLTTSCAMLVGNATAGPKTGMARSKLCQDYVDCAHRTKCAQHGYFDCLCGKDVDYGSDCYGKDVTSLTGACRAEVLAAAETTEWPELSALIANTDLTSALTTADAQLTCSRAYCFDACYDSLCPGMPDGSACGTLPANQPNDRACSGGTCAVDDTYSMLLPDGGFIDPGDGGL